MNQHCAVDNLERKVNSGCGRVLDTDYTETSELARTQIIQQAAIFGASNAPDCSVTAPISNVNLLDVDKKSAPSGRFFACHISFT